MIAESRDSEPESDKESAERGPSGWRKVVLWIAGAAVLAVVGYRGALGTRESAPDRPSIAAAADVAGAASAAAQPGSAASARPSAAASAPASSAQNVFEAPAAAGASETDGASDAAGAAGAAGAAVPSSSAAAREPAPSTAASSAPRAGGATHGITPDGRVVLNVATEAELRKLPGIGKSRARAILAHREKLGRFRRLEDLLRVKGIGPRRLAELRAKVVLDPP